MQIANNPMGASIMRHWKDKHDYFKNDKTRLVRYTQSIITENRYKSCFNTIRVTLDINHASHRWTHSKEMNLDDYFHFIW